MIDFDGHLLRPAAGVESPSLGPLLVFPGSFPAGAAGRSAVARILDSAIRPLLYSTEQIGVRVHFSAYDTKIF